LTRSYWSNINMLVFVNIKDKIHYLILNMSVAVILTGQYRCFDKICTNIEKYLLTPNKAKVFVYCETSLTKEELRKNLERKWGGDIIGDCNVYKERPLEFHAIYKNLVATKPAIQPSKFAKVYFEQHYLWTSGSILEYYQYMKAFDLLSEYEKQTGEKFDIIVRSRLDIVYGECLYLSSFFNHIDSGILERIGNAGKYIMNLGNETLARNNNRNPPHYGHTCDISGINFDTEREILDHIRSASYIWTLGPNQVWIGRREIMGKLHKLIYSYGDYDIGSKEGFNSETQFTQFCKARHIKHFIRCAAMDSKYSPFWSDPQYNRSLYQYISSGKMPKDFIMAIMR